MSFCPCTLLPFTNILVVQYLSPMLLLNKCQTTFPRTTQRMLKFTGCHHCFMEFFGSDLKRKANVGGYSRFLYVNSKNSVQEETTTQILVLLNYCKLSVRAMNP